MESSSKVRFVRIRGRIVPIKINKKKAKKGLNSIAKGAAVTAGASLAGGLFREKSLSLGRAIKNAEDVQIKRHNFGRGESKSVNMILGKLGRRQAIFHKLGRGSFAVASLIGGALLSKGLSDLGKSQSTIDIGPNYEEEVGTFASTAVGFGLAAFGGQRAAKFGVKKLRKVLRFAGKANPFRASGLAGIKR